MSPGDASGSTAALGQRLRAIGIRAGLLPLIVVAFAMVAAAVHAVGPLPWRYTWLRPLEIIVDVVRGRGFVAVALVAALLGTYSRKRHPGGEGDVSSFRDALQLLRRGAGRTWPEAKRTWSGSTACTRATAERMRTAVVTAAAFFVVAVLGKVDYSWLDWACVLPLGLVLGAQLTTRRARWRIVAELAFVALAFSVVSYGFTVLKASLFLVTTERDAELMNLERQVFGVVPHRAVASWVAQHPALLGALDRTYYRLFEHMAIVSVFLTALGRSRERIEYLGALALCYVLGGFTYYAFPAMGPAYADPEAFAFLQHHSLITNHFQPLLWHTTTGVRSGVLQELRSYDFIACMPSLHMAHEAVMLFHARRNWFFFAASLAFTAFSGLSVVALGWHYPVDVLGGLLLAALALFVVRRARGWLLPRPLMPD